MTDQNAAPASQINTTEASGEAQKVLTTEGVEIASIEDLENPQSLEKPQSGQTSTVEIQAGQDYVLAFSEDEMLSFVQEGDIMTVTFNDGSTLIISNFVSSTTSEDPAHLVFQNVDGVLDDIKVVDTTPSEDVLEEPQDEVRNETASDGEIVADAIGNEVPETELPQGEDVANIEPAAGEAERLAQIEPAAGETGAPGGPQNTGFTFSDPTITPIGPLSAVGPLGPTLLNYGIDYRNDIVRPEDEVPDAPVDDQPIIVDPAALNFDETNLVGGALSQTDNISVNFGNDGPGTIAPDGTFSFSGSATGGALTSNGVPVDVTPTAAGYVGTAGGNPVFTLTIDPVTGDYTFTLNGVLDHADGTDPNDTITLDFGVVATDSDGDTALATITVNVADDAPVTPADDSFTVDEDNLGPIVITDSLNADFGQDGAGAVTPSGDTSFSGVTALTAVGVPVVITTTANGYEGLAGATKVFDITFDAATGDYTFTLLQPLDHDAPGSDTITVNFGAKVTDFDGDSATGTITVNITDSVPKFGDTPVIGKGIETIDETNFTAAGTSVSGALDVDFGSDGGSISTTNDFQSTGSMAGGTLKSGGADVTVTATANGYVGTINGGADTVFTITVNASTGEYTYTQVLPFDHADGTNPNDQITLQFGVRVTDGDGDTDDGQITVHVLDDAPSISSPVTHSVYEQNVDTAPQSVSGNLSVDFGEDGAGDVHPTGTTSFNGVPALTSNGEAITVSATANGYVGTLASGGTAFEITIDGATGAYTFTQFEALDHATGKNELTLNFGVGVTDYDGDSATTNIAIKVKDSKPEIGDNPTVGKGVETVDETNLPSGVEANGKIDINFGSDLPGSLNLTGTTSSSTPLTHEGQTVTITAVAGGYVGTVNAGTKTIFTLDVNSQTGEYSFKLLDTLDHPNASNPNDAIQIKFGVIAVDHDGDSDLGDITINVLDDGPVAHDDFNHYDTTNGGASGNVITGLNGGAGAADDLSQDNGADEAHDHDVVQVSFKGNVVDVPAGGFATIEGDNGTLKIYDNGDYTYTLKPGAVTNTIGAPLSFSETLEFPVLKNGVEITGDALNNLGVKDGVLDFTGEVQGNVQFVSEGARMSNTLGSYTIDANGNIMPASIIAKNANDATPANGLNFSADQGQSLGFFIIADGNTVNNGYSGVDLNNGTLQFVYKFGTADERVANINDNGADLKLVYTNGTTGAETVLSGPIYHTTTRGGGESLNVDGSVRVVSGLADDTDPTTLRIGFEDLPRLGDKDYEDVVFDIKVSPVADCIMDEFGYVLQDGDGDQSSAVLELCGKDMTDDNPILATPKTLTVDETDLAPTDTAAAAISADFGTDGPGTFNASGTSTFTFTGAKDGTLTSNGTPVNVSVDGNDYIGTANGAEIFRLILNKISGEYEFVLKGILDHADTTDPDDAITLNFGVTALDKDGDVATTTITVNVKDDGPDAINDTATVQDNQSSVNGNVVTNDSQGQDKPATVTEVEFKGTTYAVTAGGGTTVNGDHGTLKISADGSFTYTSKGTNTTEVVDNFKYTLTDADGDSDKANLNVTIKDIDDRPIIVKTEKLVTDETDLNPTDDASGKITANFYNDGPGTYNVTNASSFKFEGAQGGTLTSNGIPVTVSVIDNSYVGMAQDVEIFRLDLNKTTGEYDFVLKGTLDHADATNPNDAIKLTFGVNVKDADGDTATSTIKVDVLDDAPVAHDDFNHYDTTNGGTNGNVITGLNGGAGAADVLSQDNGADEAHDHDIVQVSFKGNVVDVPAGGFATIEGDNGTLKIYDNGDYTYTLKPGAATSLIGSPLSFDETLEFPVLKEGVEISGTTLANLGVKDGALDFTGEVQGNVQFVSEGARMSNTLGSYTVDTNGNIMPARIIAKNGNEATPANGLNFSADQGQSLGFFIIADGNTVNNGYSGVDLNNGTLQFVYKFGTADERVANINDNGADLKLVYTDSTTGAETVLSGPIYHTTTRGGSENLNADSTVRVVSGLADDTDPTTLRIGFEDLPRLGDKDYQDVVFDVQIRPVDDCIMDEFGYVLQDGDGDQSSAVLELCGKDMTDDNPIIIKTEKLVTDETDLAPIDTDHGVVTANFFNDGPGTYNVTSTSGITFSGAKNNTLTSNGVPVVLAIVGNSYVGKANGAEIFRLDLNKTTGSYEFTLKGVLDHADPTNPDDIITLNFGVSVQDIDGDTATGSIKVLVKDDGPVANDDYAKFKQSDKSHSGDVTSNDEDSMDIPNKVTKVAFGDQSVDVPTSGEAVIKGDFGTLHLKADGSYNYVLDAAIVNATAGSKTYTLNPNAGDVSGYQTSITKNGFVVKIGAPQPGSPITQTGDLKWHDMGQGAGIGIGSNGSGDNKVWPRGETLTVDMVEEATHLKITLADIGSNNIGHPLTVLIYPQDGGAPVEKTFNVPNPPPANHLWTFEIDSTDIGGKTIDKIDLFNKPSDKSVSFMLNNIEYKTPAGICETKDEFKYTYKDFDGDLDTAVLTLETECEPLPPEGKCIVGTCYSDKLVGTDGADQIYGLQGNDKIIGGAGDDLLYGGSGKDVFIFKSITDGVDTIGDFNAYHDQLDVSALLQGYDALQDSIDDFLFATESKGHTTISVDADGAAGGMNAVEIAVLRNVTGLDIEDITNNGEKII